MISKNSIPDASSYKENSSFASELAALPRHYAASIFRKLHPVSDLFVWPLHIITTSRIVFEQRKKHPIGCLNNFQQV